MCSPFGKVLGKHEAAKHLHVTITDTSLIVTRNSAAIDAEAALDGAVATNMKSSLL
jgi:hypothetical protein